MKKVLFLMAAVVAVMFTACTKGGSAKDAVDAAMKCLVAQDYKGYAAFSYVDEGANKEAVDNAITLAANAAEKLYKENPVTEYEILKEEAQGEDAAVVEVKIKQKDGKETTSKMNMVKNKAGEWKIKDSKDGAEAAPEVKAEEKAEEAVDAAKDAAADAAADIEKAADEAVKAIEEAVKE
ncbi:MAG: DUF4878 domain-containing protein [Prevotella sp.]|nr:DUF4878 domain-containing protein [Prevotella sp.]